MESNCIQGNTDFSFFVDFLVFRTLRSEHCPVLALSQQAGRLEAYWGVQGALEGSLWGKQGPRGGGCYMGPECFGPVKRTPLSVQVALWAPAANWIQTEASKLM